MAEKFRVRQGDEVMVLTGKDKGKRGKVLKVIRDDRRVIVEGVNMLTSFNKPKNYSQSGYISKIEGSIHISNVAHVNPSDETRTKVTYKYYYGKKLRCSKRDFETVALDVNRIGK